MNQYFITATDTDAGKTFFARALVHAFVHQHQSQHKSGSKIENKVAVFKPISAGCEIIDEQLVNEDAQVLLNEANCQQSIAQINPIAFVAPIAPHIAAAKQNRIIEVEEIYQHYQQVQSLNADITIVEGAGGWRLPLGLSSSGETQFLSDFVKRTKLDVILVVNMKLGCLNHALLTFEAIQADGLNCVAWVANCQVPMNYLEENIAELESLLPIPKIAQFGYFENISFTGISAAAKQIDLSLLPY